MWKKVKYPENFIKILNIKIFKALKSIKSSLILQHSIAYGVVFGKTKYFAILINLISRFDLQQHFVKCWKKFQILQRLFDTLDNFSLQKPSTFKCFSIFFSQERLQSIWIFFLIWKFEYFEIFFGMSTWKVENCKKLMGKFHQTRKLMANKLYSFLFNLKSFSYIMFSAQWKIILLSVAWFNNYICNPTKFICLLKDV